MRVATFNCNSVRKRLDQILAWSDANPVDLLALQETKVVDEDFPVAAFQAAGLHVVYCGQKSYNGVAMVTREPVEVAAFGLGDDDGESGPRFAHVRVGGIDIVNTYVPQGQALDSPKFAFKLAWFGRLEKWFSSRFDPQRDPVLWVGDLNVAPTPADVYAPEKLWPHVCFCQEAIDAWQGVMNWGFVDLFRKHIDKPEEYTFWDYRLRGALARGLGWRIDHILATPPLADRSLDCWVDRDARGAENPSDHTFVVAAFTSGHA